MRIALFCGLLPLFSLVASFQPPITVRRLYSSKQGTGSRWWSAASSNTDKFDRADDDASDDDEDDKPRAYGNRSLAWTNRYRKLLPYEGARRRAMDLGLRSADEWEEVLADGKVFRGPYLPSRPDEMYADDWVSWEEFLGIMRPYEEARQLVQSVLQLHSMEEYVAFIASDTKRAEGLRIPAKPEIVYRGKGWVSDEEFFGVCQGEAN